MSSQPLQNVVICIGLGISITAFVGTHRARDKADVSTEHVGLRALMLVDAAKAVADQYDGVEKLSEFSGVAIIDELFDAEGVSCADPADIGKACTTATAADDCDGIGFSCEGKVCTLKDECALEKCNAYDHLKEQHCNGDTCTNADVTKCKNYWNANKDLYTFFEADNFGLESHKEQIAWRAEFSVPFMTLYMVSKTVVASPTAEHIFGRTPGDTATCDKEYKNDADKCSYLVPAATGYPHVTINVSAMRDIMDATASVPPTKTDVDRVLACDTYCGKQSKPMLQLFATVTPETYADYAGVTHACRSMIPYCAETRVRGILNADNKEQATPAASKTKYETYFLNANARTEGAKSFWVHDLDDFAGDDCFGRLPSSVNDKDVSDEITAVWAMWVALLTLHAILIIWRIGHYYDKWGKYKKVQSVFITIAIGTAVAILVLNGLHMHRNRKLFYHKVEKPDGNDAEITFHEPLCFGKSLGEAMGYVDDGKWRELKAGYTNEVLSKMWEKEDDELASTHHLLRGPTGSNRYQILDTGPRMRWTHGSMGFAVAIVLAHLGVLAMHTMDSDTSSSFGQVYSQVQSSLF